jgi:hypothetical protein
MGVPASQEAGFTYGRHGGIMTSLQEIKSPITAELKDFEPYFRKSLSSDIPLLSVIVDYIYRTRANSSGRYLYFFQPNFSVSPTKIPSWQPVPLSCCTQPR